ncbi:MAG TPA: ABC transporter permease [Candidatus Avisuccinivibrio pullicola]|nr:ABC transporter permease [Candidatus Avisuccinivibrio pullicola]
MTLLKGRTLIVLTLLVIFFSFASESFFTSQSLLLVAKHVALYGILGIGMTYVLVTGGIDLSVGAVVGVAGMVCGYLINQGLTVFGYTIYFSVPSIVIIAIVIGIVIGAVNGIVITKFTVAPFIATLGMMYVARGIANLISNGATFPNLVGKEALGNTGFEIFGRDILGFPVAVIILILIAVIAAVILRKTPFGWHILAIGGNERAAKLSGVHVDNDKILVYMFSGACSAVVGIIATSQLVASHPMTGNTWEMNAIAAAVLGGTSLFGGVGTIVGTIIGAFIIGVISDGMVMCGVSEFWQMIIKGLVIVLAVIVDQYQRNLQARMALQARNENK